MESRVGLAAGENALNTCGMQASILVRQGALRSARELLVECNPDGLAATANRWRQGYAEVLFATGDLAGANEVVASLREQRSEEHTSELQSLMRISYAVFCLKKKTLTKYIDVSLKQVQQNITETTS